MLSTLLGQGGTLDTSSTAHDNAVTYALQKNNPELNETLFAQFTAVTALYEAINRLLLAQTTVLNGGSATSLTHHWDVISALDEYLTLNSTALNVLLSGNFISGTTGSNLGNRTRRVNTALEWAGLRDRLPYKKDLRDRAIDISLLASLPSLSSSVAVPPVQSQPVGTGQAQGTVPTAPVRTTTPLQAGFNPMSSANVQPPNVFAPSSSTFSQQAD